MGQRRILSRSACHRLLESCLCTLTVGALQIHQTLCNVAEVESTSTHLKRKYADLEGDTAMSVPMEEENGGDTQQSGSTGEFHTKKQSLMPTTSGTSCHLGHDLNFPIPGEEGLPCLVKVHTSSLALPFLSHVWSIYIAVQRL